MSNAVIESEWVDTGAEFALSHPVAQHLGAVWLVVAWVAIHAVLACWQMVEMFRYGGNALFVVPLLVLLVLNDIVALLTLIARHPLASRSVWICLIMTFPLSIPLMFYWADGVRPNLIYRHRFGRLVQQKAAP